MKYYNKKIVNKVNLLSADYPCSDFDFDLKQCYMDISSYIVVNKKDPEKIRCEIKNGVLYIDNIKCNKVVYKIKKYNPFAGLSDNAPDYENLILARQEKYID